jgi:hypothetical protein
MFERGGWESGRSMRGWDGLRRLRLGVWGHDVSHKDVL